VETDWYTEKVNDMDYIIHLLIIIALYIPFALSLDLIVGRAGILSITHAAFYGLGAYTTAILTKFHNVSFFTTVLIGMCISSIVAVIISYSLKKVRGDYYALASIGLGVIMYSLFMNLDSITKGPFGIFGIARPSLFGVTFSSNISFLVLTAVLAGLSIWLMHTLTKTHFTRVLHAIREDEDALVPFSYKPGVYKVVIFAIGALFASLSGSLYASYISFIDPSSFTLNESIFLLTVIILGGLASTRGVIAGVVVLTLLPEALRFIGLPNEIAAQTRVIIYGVALVYLMYKRPSGLFGTHSL
jgi:branched-chain amino acid transport system permease protein